MKLLNGYLDDAYSSWLSASVSCCSPLREEHARPVIEKPMRIEHHQPRLVPPPIPEPQEVSTRGREWATRTKSFASRASSRGSFSVRRTLNAYNGPRRPRIGHPSNFQHLENSTTTTTRWAPGQERFRPLELSIYMPENHLSPLPHFGNIDDLSFPSRFSKELPYPPTALTQSRSESALSFRIPRKPIRSGSASTVSEWSAQFKARPGSLSAQELLAALEHQLPQAPPPARLRAKTDPPAYERVKSALHERYELEQRLKDIDEIIEERKSVYFNSRPTSRMTSRPTSIYSDSQEPMPGPTLLAPFNPTPQAAPSFAERVSSPLGQHPLSQRPWTAPSKTVHIPSRLVPFTEASATFTTPSPSSTSSPRPDRALAPPPPLPLVLQTPHPPLRKKKSFSRVSTWLFPSGEQHSRNISLDSITNTPKPVTSKEGFYQCVDLRPSTQHIRSASLSTVSTLESELDEPTIPTSWSPNSSPGGSRNKQQEVTIREMSMDSERNEKSIELTRVRTFGEKSMGHDETWRMEPMPALVPGRNSVGVAF